MKTLICACTSLLLSLFINCDAQIPDDTTPAEYLPQAYEVNNAQHPCITASEYAIIEEQCNKNRQRTGLNIRGRGPLTVTPLVWPLQPSPRLHDCSYYFVAAYVDHDNLATTFKDYNCGVNSYDGHTGTDIAISPFPFYKMDSSYVAVICAAAGTIINKHDGEYDRNCVGSGSGLTANYIIIQHADGSVALYWHMKKNAFTSKVVGQTVAAGEFLGVVGSSGSSSGAHLHFEVWTGTTASTMIDPYAGTCNLRNSSTWWVSQKPSAEPAVVKASVHTTDIVTPPCPTTETTNESTSYTQPFQGPGLAPGYAKFYAFLRNVTSGQAVSMSILNPDLSVFSSWDYVMSTTSKFSTIGFSKKLPLTAGIYTYKAVYNGVGCEQDFEILTLLPLSLASFTGEAQKEGNRLLWQTVSENNSDYFGIEKSSDGVAYEETGRVRAAGNSAATRSYAYMDNNEVAGRKYYRLRQVAVNGTFTYSNTISLYHGTKGSLVSLYPNPSSGRITIELGGRYTAIGKATLRLFNALGEKVMTRQLLSDKTTLDVAVQKGAYYYTVTIDGAVVSSGKLIIR